jgi:hypothetical protein
MSGKGSFLEDERKNIEKAVIMIEDLMEKTDLSKYEVIALGTLLKTYIPVSKVSYVTNCKIWASECKRMRTGIRIC